jgi:hypothetical protein
MRASLPFHRSMSPQQRRERFYSAVKGNPFNAVSSQAQPPWPSPASVRTSQEDRQTDIQTDRQADRQTDIQTDRQRGREREREIRQWSDSVIV